MTQLHKIHICSKHAYLTNVERKQKPQFIDILDKERSFYLILLIWLSLKCFFPATAQANQFRLDPCGT